MRQGRFWLASGVVGVLVACGARSTPPPVEVAPADASIAVTDREPPIVDAGPDACVVGTREPADDGCNSRICMAGNRWATTLLDCDVRVLTLRSLDGTSAPVCRRTGARDGGTWAPRPEEPWCVILADLEDPASPTTIGAARTRASECGGPPTTIELELELRVDGTVARSRVVQPTTLPKKVAACVAAAYDAVTIRTLPPRAQTLRVHNHR